VLDEPGDAGEETLADASPEESARRRGIRERIRRRRTIHLVYRTVIGVLGGAIIVLGIILLPLPGPGWLVIFLGLGLLATEFEWAERLLEYAKDKVLGWTHWVQRQSLAVRALIGLGCLLIVVGAVWLYDEVVGVPGWVPVIG
jgi:uncharacterized protein (TIGR02611 family)